MTDDEEMVTIPRDVAELAAEALSESINPDRETAADVMFEALGRKRREGITIKEYLERSSREFAERKCADD